MASECLDVKRGLTHSWFNPTGNLFIKLAAHLGYVRVTQVIVKVPYSCNLYN